MSNQGKIWDIREAYKKQRGNQWIEPGNVGLYGGDNSILNKDATSLTHEQSSELRNQSIGFIFQTYNLLPVYTVYENVEFPLLLLGISAEKRKKMVEEALEWIGLSLSLIHI